MRAVYGASFLFDAISARTFVGTAGYRVVPDGPARFQRITYQSPSDWSVQAELTASKFAEFGGSVEYQSGVLAPPTFLILKKEIAYILS